jgi:FkbM family methyltransferase
MFAFNMIENNGNAEFAGNGERVFVIELFKFLVANAHQPFVMFDVGANVGRYSRMLLDQARQDGARMEVHIFEPLRECVSELRRRFGDLPHVRIVDSAASDKNGVTTIFFDQPGSTLASLYRRSLGRYAIEMNLSEEIKSVRLDDYMKQRGLQHIHFLKLDVEGHESAALEGMGQYLDRAFVDFVQFEYGGANLDSGSTLMQLFACFEARGFRVAKVMRRGLEFREYEAWMENYQYANYVAVSESVVDALR